MIKCNYNHIIPPAVLKRLLCDVYTIILIKTAMLFLWPRIVNTLSTNPSANCILSNMRHLT